MATQKQIDANNRNALLSCGPKTADGKSKSSTNSTKHGLSGKGPNVIEARAATFASRRAAWAASVRPQTDEGAHYLDLAVAASVRLDQCQDDLDALTAAHVTRARLTWDLDRRAEAAAQFARLAKDPEVVARELERTRFGAERMIDAWAHLAQVIDERGDWSEAECSDAHDLLGTPPERRSFVNRLTPPPGVAPADHRREVAHAEAGRLRRLKTAALDAVDDLERRTAEAALLVVLDKSARLVLRYEREAWLRMERSMKVAKTSTYGDTPYFLPSLDVPDESSSIPEAFEPEPEPEPRPEVPVVAAKVEPAREPVASRVDVRAIPREDRRVEDHVVTTVECPPRTQLSDIPTHDALGRKLNRRERKALKAKAHRRSC